MKPFCHCVKHEERDIEEALEREVNKHGGRKQERMKKRDREEKRESLNVLSNETDKTLKVLRN